MTVQILRLKKGKEKLVQRRHPWVFDGALEPVDFQKAKAGIAELRDSAGRFVGVGICNPASAIALRLFRFTPGNLDVAFFTEAFSKAKHLREKTINLELNTGYRLIHGEGDGLSGLVVDNYAGHLVVQVGTPGLEALREHWLQGLETVFQPLSIARRADQGVANREHFTPEVGIIHGLQPDEVTFLENGVPFTVSIGKGQKTGFFFDQRENRALMASLSARGRILDTFCYHGGFALTALARGAKEAVAVDSSADAIEATSRNAVNAGVENRLCAVKADCHEFLRQEQEPFDVVVVDPPALAKRSQHVDKAARAYKDLFLHGLRRVKPGGAALLCSCSGAVRRDLFDMIVASAVQDSGRSATIIAKTGAGPDHPVLSTHPEGEYLKASVLIVTD